MLLQLPQTAQKDTSCITGLGTKRRKNISAMSKCFLTTGKEISFLLYLSEIDGEVNEWEQKWRTGQKTEKDRMDYGSRHQKSIAIPHPTAMWPHTSHLVHVAPSQASFILCVNTFGKGLWICTCLEEYPDQTYLWISIKRKLAAESSLKASTPIFQNQIHVCF